MMGVPPPSLAPPPPLGGGNAQQVCEMPMKTSVSVPRRSRSRKRVLEFYELDSDLIAAKSSASKKLFSSRGDSGRSLGASAGRINLEVASVSENPIVSSGVLPLGCHNLTKAEQLGSSIGEQDSKWRNLGVTRAELCLDLTFPTGQTFRWRKTGLSQYTGVIGAHLVSLRQVSDEVEFFHHATSTGTVSVSQVENELRDYLSLDTSLVDLYRKFTAADARFAAVAPFITGARLLRQSPVECVFQFICSSNNHIQRIATMVEYLSSQGLFLGSVNGIRFHQFPSLEQLLPVSESQLRENGFGYRAKYIVGTARKLHEEEIGGEQWLLALRDQPLDEAVTSLCTLPGIGPKVAACIALFSLDQHHAIPVDTHVWQIAVRYLLPELEGQKLTVKLHRQVAEAFVERFGSYAGWAHTVLFIAELSSQQNLLPFHLRVQKKQPVKTSR